MCFKPRWWGRTRRGAVGSVLLVGLFLQAGCYHYRVGVSEPDPATDYERRVRHSFLWGLIQQDQTASDCLSNALDEVRVTTNFAYLAVSVVSLGAWVPLQVEWRCAKSPPPGGDI